MRSPSPRSAPSARLGPGEAEQVGDDLRAALGLLLDHLQERFVRLPAVPREDDLHHAEDPGERIVELVREAGAHLPDERTGAPIG